MESLIFSNSLSSSKIHLKPHPLLPRLTRLDSVQRLGSFPFRFNSLSIRAQGENFLDKHFGKLASLGDLSNGVEASKHGSFKKIIQSGNYAKMVIAARNVALFAILVLLVNPVIVSPAFASFQTAAKAGAQGASAGNVLMSSELLSSAWTGFLAGCLHTLSGPDHLAALAPLSIGRTRMESAAVGALWGCGHDAGQLIFGLLFLLLKDRLHIEIIRNWGTRVVGITLLIIGAMGIKEASEVPTPCVALETGECEVGTYEALEIPTTGKKKIGFATFATGIVHGLQPDALMMILPALALPSRLAGAAFLGTFLIGTVAAMASYTVLIGSCSEALKDRIPRITEKLTWASSLVAIGLGLSILVSQFFGFSLY
ncbi:hypothetical protein Leryth_009249 [Lithospermum erythrorhizon]|nr:hypothetical protein Leryth_009249 [Lithospermum erythrorhizon]